jgi:hypothetical protein
VAMYGSRAVAVQILEKYLSSKGEIGNFGYPKLLSQ